MPPVRRLLLNVAAGSLLLAGCAADEPGQVAHSPAPLPDLPGAQAVASVAPDAEDRVDGGPDAGEALEAGAGTASGAAAAGVPASERREVEDALVGYLAGIEALRADPAAPVAPLYGLTRGELTDRWLTILRRHRGEGMALSGHATVLTSTVTAGAAGTWDVTACLDISGYQMYDREGAPVPRDADYPDRNVNHFTLERHEGALYLVADTATREAC